jgi:hypothetical protein
MIRPATAADTPTICRLVRALAEYERLPCETAGQEERLREHLFGPRPCAEVLLAEDAGAVVGFALFFPCYSTRLRFLICPARQQRPPRREVPVMNNDKARQLVAEAKRSPARLIRGSAYRTPCPIPREG